MRPSFPLLLADRLDWGFGNPNKTAALIAILMVAGWILPFLYRRLFWLALLICTGLGVCLMETGSRGGIVAAMIVLAVLLARAPRPWPRSYLVGAMGSVWVIVGAAAWLPTIQRFSKGISGQDLSITQRLELWRAAPRMMVDAPGGWGVGNAADGFRQWYQPLERTDVFGSLINSHLTWLVEIGWPWRFCYVLGWFAVLAVCWPGRTLSASAAWLMIPWGIWLTFAVTAWFSSVATSPWLWALPAVSLVGALAWRAKNRQWPGTQTWLAVGLGACGVVGMFILLGSTPGGRMQIHRTDSRVVLGKSSLPEVWVVTDAATLGKDYGRTLRQHLRTAGQEDSMQPISIGFVDSVEALRPAETLAKTVVVAGTPAPSELARLKTIVPVCARLILLNPGFFPQNLVVNPPSAPKIEVVAGEFSHVPVSAWADATKHPALNVDGAGDFLPRWPELVLYPAGVDVRSRSDEPGKLGGSGQ